MPPGALGGVSKFQLAFWIIFVVLKYLYPATSHLLELNFSLFHSSSLSQAQRRMLSTWAVPDMRHCHYQQCFLIRHKQVNSTIAMTQAPRPCPWSFMPRTMASFFHQERPFQFYVYSSAGYTFLLGLLGGSQQITARMPRRQPRVFLSFLVAEGASFAVGYLDILLDMMMIIIIVIIIISCTNVKGGKGTVLKSGFVCQFYLLIAMWPPFNCLTSPSSTCKIGSNKEF